VIAALRFGSTLPHVFGCQGERQRWVNVKGKLSGYRSGAIIYREKGVWRIEKIERTGSKGSGGVRSSRRRVAGSSVADGIYVQNNNKIFKI
jgi:hypothetical protein